MSQSPQIGSMFLTSDEEKEEWYRRKQVAIPSNRVNVSYTQRLLRLTKSGLRSQSPQIGSMFLTTVERWLEQEKKNKESQSPQIGSMFLTYIKEITAPWKTWKQVAIPSNRVNVSYIIGTAKLRQGKAESQSPQIGSMFLTLPKPRPIGEGKGRRSQSPQIGSMFLTIQICIGKNLLLFRVAIPSNRVNVSYMVNGNKEVRDFPPVAIPSNRVNVSYGLKQERDSRGINRSRNPLKSGQCFLRIYELQKNPQL